MEQIRVTGVERESVRPHPTAEGSVLVTARLSEAPSRFWRARFNQALLATTQFGRFELGPEGSSVEIAVERDGAIGEHLDELTRAVERANADVEEARRANAEAAEIREDAEAVDVDRVRGDIDRLAP
jgi:hypothetical protein